MNALPDSIRSIVNQADWTEVTDPKWLHGGFTATVNGIRLSTGTLGESLIIHLGGGSVEYAFDSNQIRNIITARAEQQERDLAREQENRVLLALGPPEPVGVQTFRTDPRGALSPCDATPTADLLWDLTP